MLGKIIGILAMMSAMSICFIVWYLQDLSLWREDSELQRGVKEIPEELTMVLRAIHFVIHKNDSEEQDPESGPDEIPKSTNCTTKPDEMTEVQSERSNLRILIPQNRGRERESAADCAICLNVYAEGEEVVWSNNPDCPHVLHRNCMRMWISKLEPDECVTCPCCRQCFLLSQTGVHTGGDNAREESAIATTGYGGVRMHLHTQMP